MSNVLITGGAGFLGINLTRYLLDKGYSVRIVDTERFDYPDVNKKVERLKADIRNKKAMDAVCKGMDYVIHCAAALPLYSKEDIYSTDVVGTRNILESSLKNKVKRVIHISTTAVYGIPKKHPIYETDPMDGVGYYGKAKILAEEECEKFRAKGMIVPILRPKSFIGPERLGVFALFFDWAQDGRGFPLMGSGKNRYQFLDVYDVCTAIHLCMTKKKDVVNDAFNLGAKDFQTMKKDFQAVLDYEGKGGKVSTFPAEPMIFALRILEFFHLSPLYKWVYETAHKDSFVSIEKAQKKLGWKPKYSNKASLVRTYVWYKKNWKKYNTTGTTHRVPWKQGILKIVKVFF